ncbi:hypothetical protein EGH24_05550 [Halonotius terrestris]|uniref:DUF7964 domain-containing protein n=1 Tax=Halonotius terrestris TaxID=2487750 RepID=A0A8J8PCY8_9EURY|nr:hypothetical protein [Halonotius terrestris]TQQ82902.1 hypothetical protein EGH24_05550 [Halonotius terrestris]
MVDKGDLLEPFPDSKISTTALTDLESHDAILTAIPVMAEEQGPMELSDRVVVQTEAVAIVAVYEDDEGWYVAERVDGTDRENDAVFQEAMVAAQGDSELVESPAESDA